MADASFAGMLVIVMPLLLTHIHAYIYTHIYAGNRHASHHPPPSLPVIVMLASLGILHQ